MVLGGIDRRDCLLLLALAGIGPIWYGGVRAFAAVAGLIVAGWAGFEGGMSTEVLLTFVGALASVFAASVVMRPIVRYARSPRVLAAVVAVMVPVSLALGLELEFNASTQAVIRVLGVESLAFSGTCLSLGRCIRNFGCS
jgi:hypothetical protein